MNETSEKSVADVLNEAAEIVASGWCQGSYRQGGRVCLEGALLEAGRHASDATRSGAFCAIAAVVPPSSDDLNPVVAWNDAVGRTQGEVVAKLLEAAAIAKAEGR